MEKEERSSGSGKLTNLCDWAGGVFKI